MKLTRDLRNKIVDTMLEVWETSDQWTKGTIARSDDQDEVGFESYRAVRWCAVGCAQKAMTLAGIEVTYWYDEFEAFINDYTEKYTEGKYRNVVHFNDAEDTSFEDIRLLVKCLRDVDPEYPEADPAPSECPCQDCVRYRAENEF